MRVAVEPRHSSWWTDEVRDVLAAARAALCWSDRAGSALSPLWRTADWGYLRMHEGEGDPWPRYSQRALRTWAGRIADTWDADCDVYVYFNNDQGGAAPRDAAGFAAGLARLGRDVPRAWPDAGPGG